MTRIDAAQRASNRAATRRGRTTVAEICPRCGADVGTLTTTVVRHLSPHTGEWCAGAGAYALSAAGVPSIPGDDEVAARRRGQWARRSVLPKALELVTVVRDEHRLSIGAFLAALDRTHLEALAVVLAALVPEDRSPDALLDWITWDDCGRPAKARKDGREHIAA